MTAASTGERGAVLIQVALASVVLCGFCGLVVDYGVLWVARAQAQNAADAGALAGATALAFDSMLNPTVAQGAALAAAAPNKVWAEQPSVPPLVALDATCVVPGTPPPPQVPYCVTANVYRNGQFGSAKLPTFFAHLFNVTDQGVQAQAKGAAAPANTTSCLWPLALPDKWAVTGTGPGTQSWSVIPVPTMFVKYGDYPTLHLPARNSYIAPTSVASVNGFRLSPTTLNVSPNIPTGLTLTLFDQFTNSTVDFGITASQFVSVAVPRSDGGGFASNLSSCNAVPVHIGDFLMLDNAGTMTQATTEASARRALDPGATWNGSALRIQGSCSGSNPPCAMMSPRLVVLPLFDVERFEDTRRTGTPEIKIVNFVGFFINQVAGSTSIQGYFSTYPGDIDTSRPQVPYLTAFLRTGVLFR